MRVVQKISWQFSVDRENIHKDTGAGSREWPLCHGSGVTSSHASAISDYLGKSVLVVRFPHWVNSIFSIFTLSENRIRWATLRNEEKKYWSFKTEKAFKTFSHHRIDLWKVKVEVLFCRVVWPLATCTSHNHEYRVGFLTCSQFLFFPVYFCTSDFS